MFLVLEADTKFSLIHLVWFMLSRIWWPGGVPAGQGTEVAGVPSARARRLGLHEVGYMLQMSVSSAMPLDLSARPAQFLSTGRRHPRTLVPP